MKKEREVAAVEVKGTFNAQRFFETLALILSERENAKITVKVTQREKKKEAPAAGQQPAAGWEIGRASCRERVSSAV